ncbi:MAG: hypothetical protein KOO62_00040 [candidate division Zixibacteria bacterium]|nr:hypothetical protein [candidate division Zixibacteria bacterium]
MTPNRRRSGRDSSDPFYQTFLFKATAKTLLSGIVFVVLLTLTQCTVNKPEAPSWQTQVVVPLINRTYQMDEIVEKIGEDNLAIGDSGVVTFSITEELDTVSLDQDNLSTDDLSYNLGKQLGPIDIDPPSVAPVSISLSEITGLPANPPGDTGVVPEATFEVTFDMPAISTFTAAVFSTGRMDVTIENGLGTAFNSITIELVDGTTDALITSGTHNPTVSSGNSVVIPLDLAGKTVPSDVIIVSSFNTFEGTVTAVSTRYLSTEITFSDTLQVTSATAQIPGLSLFQSTSVALAEDDRIDTASLASGTLSLSLTNETPLDANLTVSVPDILSGAGVLLTVGPVAVPASQTVIVNQNLAGYQLVPQSSTVPQELSLEVDLAIEGSGMEQRTVSQYDSIAVTANLTNLVFGSVTGRFEAVSATFDGISEDIDVPTGFENIELVNATVTLIIENGIDLPGQVSIQLTGNNDKILVMGGDISPRGLATSVTTEVTNSEIADFLSPLPTHIEASGTVTFGDEAYTGTISSDDYVFASVRIEAPLEMIINESTIDIDVESETIDQSDIDAITDHFVEGRLVYRLINHLPIGAHVNIYLDGDSLNLNAENAQLTIDSLYVDAAATNLDGIVIDVASTPEQIISLDSDQIKVLENDTLYIGSEIVLHGSDGQAVKLMEDDYITVIGRIEVEYLFDGEF